MQIQNQKTKKYLQYGALVFISDNATDKQIVYSDGFVRLNFQITDVTQEVISNDIDGCIFQIVPSYTYEYYEKLQNLLTFIENQQENIVNNQKDYNFLFEQVQDEISNCLDLFQQLQDQVILFGQIVQFQHYKSKKYLTLDPSEQIPLYKESYGLKLMQKPSKNSMFKIMPCYPYQQEFSNYIKYGVDVYIKSKELSRTKDLYLATSNKKQLQENNKIMNQMGKFFFLQSDESKDQQQKNDQNIFEHSHADSTYDFFYKSDFLFANFQEKAKLRINLFRSEHESDNIFLNDCIWIIHMETNSFLIYDSEEDNKNTSKLLFENFYINNSKNTIGLWKIEGMDIQDGEKLSIGQQIRFKNLNCKKYMTIKQNNGKIKAHQEYSFQLECEVTENSQFEILPYQYYEQEYSQQNIINTQKVFFIKHVKTGRYLTKKIFSSSEHENYHEIIQPTIKKNPGQDDVFQFIKAQSFELQETLFLLSCQPPLIKGIKFINQINNQNVIQQQTQITSTDTILFNEMKQSLHLLIQYCSIEVDILNEQQQLEEKFAQTQRILREQGYFDILFRIIQSCFPNNDIIQKLLPLINQEDESKDSHKKQKLKKSLSNCSFNKSQENELKKIKKEKFSLVKRKKKNEIITYFIEFTNVCDLCFQLIQTMCKCNSKNQIMCFKYINKIKQQVGYIMGSTQCLRDILINNELLLDLIPSKDIVTEYKLAKKTLNKFILSPSDKNLQEHHNHEPMHTTDTTLIDYIYQRYRESLKILSQRYTHLNEFLDFINCLCCNKEKGVHSNQILCKNIMLDQKDHEVLLPIRLMNNISGSFLEIGSQDQFGQIIYKDLITFFDRFKSNEDSEELDYIQKQLILYSNLCKGRNYTNIAYFKSIFHPSTLIDYIWDQRICEPIRACLIELLHHIHVDMKPRTERIIPMLSKIIEDEKNSEKNSIFEKISQNLPSKQDLIDNMKSQVQKVQNVIKKVNNLSSTLKDLQHFRNPSNESQNSFESFQPSTHTNLENIASNFLIYEDSISIQDSQRLKQKLIDHFVKEIFDKSYPDQILFNEISINLIILVRKFMKFNFFENTQQKIIEENDPVKNRLQKIKNVIEIKYQQNRSLNSLAKDDPLYKLVRALLQILIKDLEEKLKVSQTTQTVVLKSFKKFFKNSKKVKQDKEDNKTKQENVIKRQVIEQMKFQIKLDQNYLLEEKQRDDNENKFKIELLRNLIYFNKMRQDHYLQKLIDFILAATCDLGSPPYNQDKIDDYIKNNIAKYIPNIMIYEITGNDPRNGEQIEDLDSLCGGKTIFSILIKYFHISKNQLFSFLIIKLILSNFNQRSYLIKNLKHLQIIQNPNEVQIFNEIGAKAIQLNFDAEQSDVWLQNNQFMELTQISYSFVIHRIIDNVQHLIELAYQDSSREDSIISNARQIMFRNKKLHEIIISLVKDCGNNLKGYKNNQKLTSQENLIINLFSKCYKFLQVFIQNRNRPNIKLILQEYNTFAKQLNYIEQGQTEFFCSLYKDNYDLVCNLNPQIIDQFVNKIINYGFNPQFINFFETIMYYKDKPYYQNWNKLLDILLDYQILTQIMMIRQNTKFEEGNKSQQEQELLQIPKIKPVKVEKQEDKIQDVKQIGRFLFNFEEKQINRGVPYIYHFQILKLMNKLIENSAEKLHIGQNLFQKILDINYLFYLISKRDIFHPKFEQTQNGANYLLNTLIKQECLKFLTTIYIKSSNQSLKQIKNNPYLIKFLTRERELLENIKDDIQLKNMLQFYEQTKSQYHEHQNYPNIKYEIVCKNSKYLKDIESNFLSYQLAIIMPVITLLYKKLILLSEADEMDTNRQDVLELLNYASEFEKFCQRIELVHINPLWLKNIEVYQNTLQCDLNIMIIEHDQGQVLEQKQQQSLDEIIKLMPLQDIINQKSIKAYDEKEIAWRSVIVSMLQSPVLEEEIIKKEQDQLINAIMNIDNFSNEKLKLDLSFFIKNILQFLKDLMFYRQNSESFLKNEVIEIPFIINQIIDFMIRLVRKNREKIQSIFQKESFMNFVGKMICGKEIQDQTFFLLIDLLNELLEGGHKELQDQFLDYLQSKRNGEQLFSKIYSFLEKEIQLVKQNNDINQRMRKIRKNIKLCYKQKKKPRVTRVMRFLQLLCEGHNTNCQIYIRKQQNSIGSSQKNYDILQLMVRMIDICFKKLNEENYGIASQTLDTLIEAIQGPCEENQTALSEGKLLETLGIIVQEKDEVIAIKLGIQPDIQKTRSKLKINMETETQSKSQGLKDIECQIVDYIQTISLNFAEYIQDELIANGDTKYPWMVTRLKYKAFITLESLTEGNTDNSILRKMNQQISLQVLKWNFTSVFQKFQDLYENKYKDCVLKHIELPIISEKNEDKLQFHAKLAFIVQNGFKAFFIYKQYNDNEMNNNILEDLKLMKEDDANDNYFLKKYKQLKDRLLMKQNNAQIVEDDDNYNSSIDNPEYREKYKNALRFYQNKTGYVEIRMNSKIFKQYFILLPFCLNLTEEDKAQFNKKVKRESDKSKLSDLLKYSTELIYSMESETHLRNYIQYITILDILWKRINWLQSTAFYLSIILNVVILIKTKDDHVFRISPIISQESTQANQVYFYLVMLCQFPLLSINGVMFLFYALKNVPIIKRQFVDAIKELDPAPGFFKKIYLLLQFVSSKHVFLYKALSTLIIFLGFFNEFFIALQLMDVFLQYPLLMTVLNSIWRPRKSILLTIMWLIILTYYFSLIVYYFFYENFISEQQEICSQLISCFSMVLDTTLRIGGGFTGYWLPEKDYYYQWTFNGIAVLMFLYNFIVTILTLTILTGIIIDTFAVLREEDEHNLKDINNICFICGDNRNNLDKKDPKKGFVYHVQQEHKIWDYLFFISYLREKDQTEYTGIESYVREKYDNKDVEWFPISNFEDQQNELNEKNKLNNILQQLDQINLNLSDLNKKVFFQFMKYIQAQQKQIEDQNQNDGFGQN